jgi:UDP-N-acetylmuramoyl-tripeptide--D-alanyl-D-alanine ligase
MKSIFKKIIITIITWQAKLVLARYHPKVIAITGSVGKTSTKDAIFTVISKFKKVRKSDKSFNSEIGIPLTILGSPNAWNHVTGWIMNIIHGFLLIIFKKPYPEYLVLEVGAGKPGDIKDVAPWLSPHIVVVTSFPDKPVHVEFFGTPEKIIEEKSALVNALVPDGVLILNHDDEKVYKLHDNKAGRQTISYGMHENATYRATYPTYMYKDVNGGQLPLGINFKLEHGGNVFPVNLPHVVGMHFVGQALVAIAVAQILGCDMLSSIEAIADFVSPPGRLSLMKGINDTTIIDDSYNSSPTALNAAIEVLQVIEGKRKIAILGDMLELGKFTEEAHRDAGERIAPIVDVLITVGLRARSIASGAEEKGLSKKKMYSFDNGNEVKEFLRDFIQSGDLILVKGSQGMRLERVVEAIMLHPEDKDHLLCRQEKEWELR